MSVEVDTLTVSLNFQTLKCTIKGNEFSRLKGYLKSRLRIPSEVRSLHIKAGKSEKFSSKIGLKVDQRLR